MGKPINKKAQTPQDMILLVVILFSIGLVCIFGYYIYAQINNYRSTIPALNTTVIDTAMDKAQTGNANFDYVFLVLYIGLSLALVAAGWFIPTDTIFLWLYIIVLLIAVLIAGIFGYIWNVFAASGLPLYATITNTFPITNYILSNLTLFELFTAALAMIATFAKERNG
jgi:hypothetical protein